MGHTVRQRCHLSAGRKRGQVIQLSAEARRPALSSNDQAYNNTTEK